MRPLGLDPRVDAARLVLGQLAALHEDHGEALVELELLRHPLLEEEALLDLRLGDVAERLRLLREEEVLVGALIGGSSPRSGVAAPCMVAGGTRPRVSEELDAAEVRVALQAALQEALGHLSVLSGARRRSRPRGERRLYEARDDVVQAVERHVVEVVGEEPVGARERRPRRTGPRRRGARRRVPRAPPSGASRAPGRARVRTALAGRGRAARPPRAPRRRRGAPRIPERAGRERAEEPDGGVVAARRTPRAPAGRCGLVAQEVAARRRCPPASRPSRRRAGTPRPRAPSGPTVRPRGARSRAARRQGSGANRRPAPRRPRSPSSTPASMRDRRRASHASATPARAAQARRARTWPRARPSSVGTDRSLTSSAARRRSPAPGRPGRRRSLDELERQPRRRRAPDAPRRP